METILNNINRLKEYLQLIFNVRRTALPLALPAWPRIGKRSRIITNKDFKAIKEGRWFNDNQIDIFLNCVSRTALSKSKAAKVHIFSAVFYSALKNFGQNRNSAVCWERMSRALKNVICRGDHLLLLPILEQNHWTLAAISNNTIILYDSLKPHSMDIPAQYIQLMYDKANQDDTTPTLTGVCGLPSTNKPIGLRTACNPKCRLLHASVLRKKFRIPRKITRALLVATMEKWSRRHNTHMGLDMETKGRLLVVMGDMRRNWRKNRYMRKDLVVADATYRIIINKNGNEIIKPL
ncbi:hypothetical protein EVAR_91295_1 [Eumeta japonica]|uniref:Ubiquitin-like protease family profile domain-containing protein n=1 Tax=Eumeta variegata TaxID=151549 RepID=A0A4C1TAA4_EUMVA|nr:hypothetical protein EVAR_91295_1 [Eumeta japonica]